MSERILDSVDQLGGAAHYNIYTKQGGPVAVASGDATGAVTFTTAFADTTGVHIGVEWVSGAPPTQGVGVSALVAGAFMLAYYGTVVDGAFRWSAWRV